MVWSLQALTINIRTKHWNVKWSFSNLKATRVRAKSGSAILKIWKEDKETVEGNISDTSVLIFYSEESMGVVYRWIKQCCVCVYAFGAMKAATTKTKARNQ